MNQETQDYINRLGEAFVDRYQIQIPVTASALETIVQSLGGTIEEMNNFDSVLEPSVPKQAKTASRCASNRACRPVRKDLPWHESWDI